MRKCERCSKTLMGRWQTRFCSRKCSTKVCNAAFYMQKICPICRGRHRNKKFCSAKCRDEAQKVLLTPEVLANRRLTTLLKVRRYQARRYNQIPDNANMDDIKEFYKNCPSGYEVDHIIPISKGGLHHQDNLQYLPFLDNRRKSNKLNWTSSLIGKAVGS